MPELGGALTGRVSASDGMSIVCGASLASAVRYRLGTRAAVPIFDRMAPATAAYEGGSRGA
jgi:hypothetical protein